jgi:hypothetical protein
LQRIEKAYTFIQRIQKPTFECKNYAVDASAALIMEAGVGLAALKCQGSDGSVRLYAGPKVMFGGGLGAMAKAEVTQSGQICERGTFGTLNVEEHAEGILGIAALISGGEPFGGGQGVKPGVGVGAKMTVGFDISPMIRLVNLPRNDAAMADYLVSSSYTSGYDDMKELASLRKEFLGKN